MGGINNAENQIGDDLTNRLLKLERDLNEFKTTPQRIGNGSMNWAIFVPLTVGPITIAAGTTTKFTILYMNVLVLFTYNGLPAINRATQLDLLYSIAVDTNDAAHTDPYGVSLSAAQQNVRSSMHFDLGASGLNETNGQRYVVIEVTNTDSGSHNYYLSINALIPRPALKPL